jgi:hypothetical protein
MLDITAFSNALRDGSVSFVDSLGARPFLDDTGAVISIRGENALIVPLGGERDTHPRYALRLPLDHGGAASWPSRYADIAGVVGTITEHLPTGVTILDVDEVAGLDVALLYNWVPGETLTARVTRSRERHARDRLTELLWPLADVADALRVGGLVHGDIVPGNLVVRPDGGMTLIDLDRMGFRDGDPPVDPRRRAGYRLPRGGGEPEEEDAYALLVLMTSVAILADANVPIDHERAPEWTHPNLLFSSWDLMDPQRSRLVREVESQLTPATHELLDVLVTASNGPSERVPAALHEAVRLVRRTSTRPEPDAASGSRAEAGWHLAERHRAAQPPPQPAPRRSIDAWPERTGSSWPEPELGAAGWPAPEPPAPMSTESSWAAIDAPAETPPAAPAPAAGGRSVDAILDELRSITLPPPKGGPTPRQHRADQRRRQIGERLQKALADNDRLSLVDLAMSGALAELGESDRQDVLQVVRALSHDAITRAVNTDDDGAILAAVDETVFANDADLDPAFRDRVALARRREAWREKVRIAARERDGRESAALLREAPRNGLERLPEAVRRQVTRLAEEHVATEAANQAIRERDPNTLARSLGQLASLRPAWTDRIDASAVTRLLGEEQIEQRLIAKLMGRKLGDEDQWMVDLVIAAGRLPEVTRLAGLAPCDVDRMIHREIFESDPG